MPHDAEVQPGLASRVVLQSVLLLGLLGALLFASAGTAAFWQAWGYLALFLVLTAFIDVYLLFKDPALLERRLALGERGEPQPKQKLIQGFLGASFFSMLLTAGLDRRFGWSSVGVPVVLAADALFVLGFLIIFFVFRENSYTSSIVEVAENQRVVSTGPYRIVRHPMYSGGLLVIAATPLALGSLAAAAFVVPLAALIVARLIDEERYLSEHLTGYAAYLNQTRYRLIPRIW